ncbi:MAG: PilN domain-containing protein [Betaproteobacteria bacterium]
MSQQINLYNPLFRRQKKSFTAAAMAQSLLGMAVALGLYYAYSSNQVRTLSRQAQVLDAQVKLNLERLKTLPAPVKLPEEEKALDAKAVELEARAAQNEQLLAQSSPPALNREYIEPLLALARQRVEGVWLTSVSLTGESGELSLSGRALDAARVPQYIERLRQDPALKGRRFATLDIGAVQPEAEKGSAPSARSSGVTFRLVASPE